jgi:hypothetical protein
MVALSSSSGETAAYSKHPEIVNLDESAMAEVILPTELAAETGLSGRLVDESGRPIPFGWLSHNGMSQNAQISPLNGHFKLDAQTDPDAPISVTAPGYWSQSGSFQELTSQNEGRSGEIVLKARPELELFEWGSGQVTIPPETINHINDNSLSLTRGWLWGENLDPEPITIEMEGSRIDADQGSFVLEYQPGEVSWLYALDGHFSFVTREGDVKKVIAGEMLAFGDGVPVPTPVESDEVVLTLLRNGKSPAIPLVFHEEPGLSARLVETASSIGSSLSQGLVAVTYMTMFIMVIGAVIFGLRRLLRAWI